MLRKKELVRALSDATHITYKDSRIIIDALLGILRGAIIVGEDVELSGVGFFTRQDVAPRKAEMGMLNPKTQEFWQNGINVITNFIDELEKMN